MNIVASGPIFRIYGDEVSTMEKLPPRTFEVHFDKMQGFYLTHRPDLEIKDEKVYGDYDKKISKVIRGYELTNRNFGIILSGEKGVGKSIFARLLAKEVNKKGMPVIVVNICVPGIENFISSIEQECMVLFDEFEKVFGRNKRDEDIGNGQEILLSLFDGLDGGKKLYCITCNEPMHLSNYFINRPGRFHYHFEISLPGEQEVRDYLSDNLLPQYKDNIEEIVKFSLSTTNVVTYDVLRALVFDLNQGYELSEILKDINISNTHPTSVKITLIDNDNNVYSGFERLFLFGDPNRVEHVELSREWRNIEEIFSPKILGVRINFRLDDISVKDSELSIDADKVSATLEIKDENGYRRETKSGKEFIKTISIKKYDAYGTKFTF